eukprot:COSAG04_NODE_399_length_14959_cov_28.238730_16_plen_236_part_00
MAWRESPRTGTHCWSAVAPVVVGAELLPKLGAASARPHILRYTSSARPKSSLRPDLGSTLRSGGAATPRARRSRCTGAVAAEVAGVKDHRLPSQGRRRKSAAWRPGRRRPRTRSPSVQQQQLRSSIDAEDWRNVLFSCLTAQGAGPVACSVTSPACSGVFPYITAYGPHPLQPFWPPSPMSVDPSTWRSPSFTCPNRAQVWSDICITMCPQIHGHAGTKQGRQQTRQTGPAGPIA